MKRASRIALIIVVLVVGIGAAGVAILNSLDFNQYRGLIAEKVKEATGRDFEIAGDLTLAISFSPALRLENVTLANAEWGSRPEMVKLGHLDAEVQLFPLLSGEARIDRIVMSDVDILLETDQNGVGNWQFGDQAAKPTAPEGASGEAPVVPVIDSVELENAAVTYRDGVTGQSQRLVIEDLEASAESPSSPIDVEGKGQVAEQPFTIKGQVGNLAALTGGDSFPFGLNISALATDIAVEGAIEKPMEGKGLDARLNLKGDALPKTLEGLAAVMPGLAGVSAPEGAFALSGHVRQTDNGISVSDLAASLGPSSLSGSASVNLSGQRPRITVDLASPTLDLAALAPAGEGGKTESQADAKGGQGEPQRLFSDDPLPLEGLRAVDANATVKVDHLVLPNGMAADGVLVTAILDRGKLTVSPLRASVAEGSLDGEVRLDGGQDAATVNVVLTGKGIVAGRLLEQMDRGGLLDGGPTDLDVKLQGRGKSMHEIMASLGGNLTVKVGEGRLNSKALDIAGGDVLMQLLNVLNPAATNQDHSKLSCAVVNFEIKDGLAKAAKGIAAETDKVNVVGAGSINLADETLDLAVKPEANSGLGINLSSTIAGLVRIKGPLTDPRVGVDEVGAAKAAASVGAALATGGLSLLGEALISKGTKDAHPCQTALAGASSSGAQPLEHQDVPERGPAKVIEGVGDAIGNIFGGGKK